MLEVLAPVQCARFARRHLRDRASHSDRPRAADCLPHRQGLPRPAVAGRRTLGNGRGERMKPAANGKVKASVKARQEKAAPTSGFGEFFLEIGCEEIPAGMIANAANELQVILKKYLALERLIDDEEVITFGAPRR